jgi:hypothetical protein
MVPPVNNLTQHGSVVAGSMGDLEAADTRFETFEGQSVYVRQCALCPRGSSLRNVFFVARCKHEEVGPSFPANPEREEPIIIELRVVAENIVAGQIDMIPTERRDLAAACANICPC